MPLLFACKFGIYCFYDFPMKNGVQIRWFFSKLRLEFFLLVWYYIVV